MRKTRSKQQLQNLLKRKMVIDDNECWLWTGKLDTHGYGNIMIRRVRHSVSRVSLHVFKDFDLKSSLDVCHTINCKSRRCHNPDHLYAGTRSQNIQDAVKAGTHRSGFSPTMKITITEGNKK
jgi:hypothetical protein